MQLKFRFFNGIVIEYIISEKLDFLTSTKNLLWPYIQNAFLKYVLKSWQWADCIMGKILKKVEIGIFITTALKGILKLVKLQSLVAKRCKMWKM